MKIDIIRNHRTYSCYSYYIRGSWNAIPDINTLIDVGTDDFSLNYIRGLNAGVGKRRVEQVILTHEHFDHAAGLKYIIQEWQPKVIAFKELPGVTHKAYDGMPIKIGDKEAVILHTPGHSHDSISIYCEEEKSIFLGDTTYNIKTPGGTYEDDFVAVLERLTKLKIEIIYSGHDEPLINNPLSTLKNTLVNVRKSTIVKK